MISKVNRIAAVLATVMIAPLACGQPAPGEPRAATPNTENKHLESPDGHVAIDFVLQSDGTPAYKISYFGKPVILESKLGFMPAFNSAFSVVTTAASAHQGEWTNPVGERKVVPDNYKQLDVDLKQASGKLLRLTFRAYNEGAAFRYTLPAQDTKNFAFDDEHTEFRFPADTMGYEEHGTEGDYIHAKIADLKPWCERPLTVELPGGILAAVGEAANQAYPRMLLSGLAGTSGAMVSALGGTTSNTASGGINDPHIQLAAGDSTPWRMFVLGEKPGDLLELNYLMLDLNPPLALKDASWIRPGKLMRDTALTTASAEAIIDLAPQLGLDYVMFDAHWYGNDDNGDATHIRAPDLDIKAVAAYGQSKTRKIGVIAYVDNRQVRKQRDAIFSAFQDWGVAGIKIGFVSVGPQTETAWITDVIAKAAENHFVLDIHDGYRPTGLIRTYPNILTVEGIQGNEHHPAPEHNCTLPFTRYIAGTGDYTPCYMDNRDQTTHAHQLAMGMISFSPLQSLYWYDKPAMYQIVPPEMEFWVHMPTVWDMTKVINGKIGNYATVARQSGDDWFVGTINDKTARTLTIPLSFLEPGKKYTAHIYSDDDKVQTPTKVSVTTKPVDSTNTLEAVLKAAGGQAIWIQAAK